MEKLKDKIGNEPVGLVALVQLVLGVASWLGLPELNIEEGGVIASILGIIVGGGVASRFLAYGPKTFKQQVSYALSLDPKYWRAAIEALGVDTKEAARLIGSEDEDTAEDEPEPESS